MGQVVAAVRRVISVQAKAKPGSPGLDCFGDRQRFCWRCLTNSDSLLAFGGRWHEVMAKQISIYEFSE